jgi:hypothetical protein
MSDTRKIQSKRFWVMAIVFAAVAGCGRAVAQQSQPVPAAAKVQMPAVSQRVLIVSIPDRELVLLEGGEVKRVYPVAVGKPSTPSPAGRFTIARQVSDPTYSHHGKVVGPGPKNPVGSRWMGLSEKGYGIHGTNERNAIGKAASHGCIRMGKADLEELYTLVQVGDAVEIHAQRDATVTMALGERMPILPAAPLPATVAQRVLLAGNSVSSTPRQGQ